MQMLLRDGLKNVPGTGPVPGTYNVVVATVRVRSELRKHTWHECGRSPTTTNKAASQPKIIREDPEKDQKGPSPLQLCE